MNTSSAPSNETWALGDRFLFINTQQGLQITSKESVKISDAISGGLKPLDYYPIRYSALNGAPSFTISNTEESWEANKYLKINSGYGIVLNAGGNSITVTDKHTSKAIDLKKYPINWSAVAKSGGFSLFGYVRDASSSDDILFYPAVRIYDGYEDEYTVYYFKGSNGWSSSLGSRMTFYSFNSSSGDMFADGTPLSNL